VPSESAHAPGGIPPGLEFFFAPPGAVAGNRVSIEGEEFAHLTHVMRHRQGDTIGIVDGAGMAYVATIADIHHRVAHCTILSTHPGLHESARAVTLAVGVLKNPSRFDLIVEKATELGVTAIIPVLTSRTIPHHAKISRWQTIALAAMKQSGRCMLPVVPPLTAFDDVIASAQGDRFLLHEQATVPLEAVISGPENGCTVCVGPEGGFADAEVAAAAAKGWKVVSVARRRLRSETAAIAAAVRLLP